MTRLTDVLKREHKAAEKCHICLKEFNDPRNKKVTTAKTTAITPVSTEGQLTIIVT